MSVFTSCYLFKITVLIVNNIPDHMFLEDEY